jgi:hypothetical protein
VADCASVPASTQITNMKLGAARVWHATQPASAQVGASVCLHAVSAAAVACMRACERCWWELKGHTVPRASATSFRRRGSMQRCFPTYCVLSAGAEETSSCIVAAFKRMCNSVCRLTSQE